MRVLSLSSERFSQTCQDLGSIIHAAGFQPDVVIGIRSGGEYVALELLPLFPGVRYIDVELSRPTTESKRRWVPALSWLPTWLLNAMRIAEAWMLRARGATRKRPREVRMPTDIQAKRVLIVDDAVDSGMTLLSVTQAVEKAVPAAQVKTAVITVTTSDPIVRPDYAIFQDHTLIRFPWSLDAK